MDANAFGDVLKNAEQGDRRAALLPLRHAVGNHYPLFAVRPYQANSKLVSMSGIDRFGHPVTNPGLVFGVVEGDGVVVLRVERIERNAVDAINLVRPTDSPGRHVQLPVPHSGDRLGQFQRFDQLSLLALGCFSGSYVADVIVKLHHGA